MQLTETVKLLPTKEERFYIIKNMKAYIDSVNGLIQKALSGVCIDNYTYRDIDADVPLSLKDFCAGDAIKIYNEYKEKCKKAKNGKMPKVPVLKSLHFILKRKDFTIKDTNVCFPIMMDKKFRILNIKTTMTEVQKEIFKKYFIVRIRILFKNNNLYCQIIYNKTPARLKAYGNIMGVDLGIKCPAVSYITNGKIKFYGNGRRNKFIKRYYYSLDKKLQEAKKIKVIKKRKNKLNRIMQDIDHKISRTIVKEAIANDVKLIKLEKLTYFQSTRPNKTHKSNRTAHEWSFDRLAKFIVYKARLEGIKVIYVKPEKTSTLCPKCGTSNHSKDRTYICDNCGLRIHRDVVGAMNIANTTGFVGKRQIA